LKGLIRAVEKTLQLEKSSWHISSYAIRFQVLGCPAWESLRIQVLAMAERKFSVASAELIWFNSWGSIQGAMLL